MSGGLGAKGLAAHGARRPYRVRMVTPRRVIALLALLLLASAWAADIGIAPPRLDLVGMPGARVTGTVTVITSARGEQQIASALGDWTLDIQGEMAFFGPASLVHGASEWITLDVDEFLLTGEATREVRLDVAIPDDAEGTHQAMVFFTVLPRPTEAAGVGVITTTRIGLTVYVTVAGTERNGAELVDLYQPDDGSLTAVIRNTGNTVMRLGGAVQIRDEAGAVVRRLEVPDVPVLRESERELTLALPDDLPSGFYVALALIEDSRGGILAGELPFDVP